MGILPNENHHSKVAHHGGKVDDQEHEEEEDLQLWLLCKSHENKLNHQSCFLLTYQHLITVMKNMWKRQLLKITQAVVFYLQIKLYLNVVFHLISTF